MQMYLPERPRRRHRRPCLFSGLLALDCDSILCSTWRLKSTTAARSEIDSQEKFIFFKVGVLTRVMERAGSRPVVCHGLLEKLDDQIPAGRTESTGCLSLCSARPAPS